MIRQLTAGAILAGTLAVAACSSSSTTSGPSSPPSAVSSAPAQSVGLTQPWTFSDGVKVQLSDVSRQVTGANAMPTSGVPYVRFTVTITNGGQKTLDLTSTVSHCAVADSSTVRPTESVYDYGRDPHAWNSNGGVTQLLPGQATSYPAGCQFGSDQHQLEVTIQPDFDYGTAVFVGPVS